MGQDSKIEWTHHTFNPVRGCTKISPGCTNCYAESLSKRNPGVLGIWGDKGTRVVASEAAWREPLKWDKAAKASGERHRVFCASLSDVFEDRPEWVTPRIRLFHLISETPNLDWLLLTKRPENIRRFYGGQGVPRSWSESIPSNVWYGASVEDRKHGLSRVDVLRKIPATVRFLSVEPLLADLGQIDLAGIGWVIVGGESGHGARGMRSDWVRSIRDQCQAAGVKFFMKQWGEWLPDDQKIPHWESEIQGKAIARLDREGRNLAGLWGLHGESDLIVRRVGKKAAGRMLDGREWNEFPSLVGAAS